MTQETTDLETRRDKSHWSRDIAVFGRADTRKAVWQMINSIGPYLAVLALMIFGMVRDWPYVVVLSLAFPAAGLLSRIFIICHDCCHDSYFASRRANRIVGYITGILSYTPFEDWKRSHLIHHQSAGDLDNRGTGDVWTMTVDEYLAAPRMKRLGYRLVRNPFFLLLVVPLWLSVISYRIPHRGAGRRAGASVILTNLALVALFVTAALTVGWKTYLLVQVPVILLTWTVGVWLFYVQHQHDGAYWSRTDSRDPVVVALKGSSYYKLPRVLQWFTGNIGLHHIHHLRPRIPNYNLQTCQDTLPILQSVKPLTLGRSLKSVMLNLWDEQEQRMVSFGAIRGRVRGG